MNQDMMLYNWKCKPSSVAGLRYVPTMEPEFSDCEQRMFIKSGKEIDIPLCIKNKSSNYSSLVHDGPSVRQSHTNLISETMCWRIQNVLEIGINVYKKPLLSTTRAILDNKQDSCVYLGVDINNKSAIDDSEKNIHTIMENSIFRNKIRQRMLEFGMSTIDLLLIDGDHSIKMSINDWCFSEFLSPFGIVIIHDTNVHSGPRALFDAIDETSFNKELIGSEMKSGKFPDYGIGIARRLF